jgi:uncharacterized alkaline shock family protein YloU
MALSPQQNELPCGVELETLVTQVADGATAPDPTHQTHCPYCQRALGDLRRAWGDVQTLASAPVPIPAGLTLRVMSRVRILARRAGDNIVLAGTRGHTQISHSVIAQVARSAALTVPGVLFASVRLTPGQTAAPARLDLAIRLVTTYGAPLQPVAAAVRAILRRRLPAVTGADVAAIDVVFADIAEANS